jgi:hypothetical protein
VPATLQAENMQILQEATTIAQAARASEEAVMLTAQAVSTQVADVRAVNLVLLATVRAGDPVDERVVSSGESLVPQLTPGQRWFVRTGVSQFINEADGCVVSPQISFTADAPIIYATLLVYNIESGVELSALWEHEGTEAYRDGFVLNRSAAQICLWFSMEQAEVEFLPGNWTVRMCADGAPLETPISFSIRPAETMVDE